MTTNRIGPGLALTLLGLNASALKAQKPGDACGLLKAAEIQTLAGTAKVGAASPSTDGIGSSLCRYEWGPRGSVQNGLNILDLSVTAMAKAFPATKASRWRKAAFSPSHSGQRTPARRKTK